MQLLPRSFALIDTITSQIGTYILKYDTRSSRYKYITGQHMTRLVINLLYQINIFINKLYDINF